MESNSFASNQEEDIKCEIAAQEISWNPISVLQNNEWISVVDISNAFQTFNIVFDLVYQIYVSLYLFFYHHIAPLNMFSLLVNDRIGVNWDSAETEASVKSTEASAESLRKKGWICPQNYRKSEVLVHQNST